MAQTCTLSTSDRGARGGASLQGAELRGCAVAAAAKLPALQLERCSESSESPTPLRANAACGVDFVWLSAFILSIAAFYIRAPGSVGYERAAFIALSLNVLLTGLQVLCSAVFGICFVYARASKVPVHAH